MRASKQVRAKGCELAVKHMVSEPGDVADMLAWCTFFTAFIEHGADWCEKNMRLMADRVGPDLKVVK